MSYPVVYAVGETVFDIIFKDYQPQAAKPGGSAFNAMISLGRLGIPCSFISEVGNDRIGRHVLDFLKTNEVDNHYVIKFEDGKSALSLAFLNEKSDAEYEFYKDYPNQRLKAEIPGFKNGDYFLFGSFYGLNPVLRPQIKSLLNAADKASTTIYYDPNFRSSHKDDLKQLKGIIEENFEASTIVRASDEDMFNIYGVDTAREAWEKVSPFCKYFIYTANARGVDVFTPDLELHLDVDYIEPISTIGAGDTFNAGVLYGLYNRAITSKNIHDVPEKDWLEVLKTAANFSKEVCLSYDNYIGVRS
ncbi:MAG TPA: PfkB family carbohydrate kinase [Bacteroidales bacterium]|nr:PfkB family carbohydrate kinase [Bacteroidales bacterium]